MYELNKIAICTDSYFCGSSKPYVQIEPFEDDEYGFYETCNMYFAITIGE